MIANLAQIKGLVAKALNGDVTVSIKGSGAKRGASDKAQSGTIFIHKSGFVTGSAASGSINIVLEGGDPDWDGAVVKDGVASGFSVPQMQVLAALVDHIETFGGKVTVNSDIY